MAEGKKILITGGAGFIGSHLADELIDQGNSLILLDDFSGANILNIQKPKHNPSKIVINDIRQYNALSEIIENHKPQIIYHLAANAAENKSLFSPIDITSRTFDGTIKLITAAINNGVEKMVFTSSIAVYGSIQTPFREDDIPQPEDLYGVAKLAAEKSLRILGDLHGLKWTIVRPHNVYGPRQNMQDPYRNVVTIWMNAILGGQRHIPIYGDGNQKRCFSYVGDVVRAMAKTHKDEYNGKVYNLGSDKAYTLNDLFEALKNVSGKDLQPEYLEARHEVKEAVADHTKSVQDLGYEDTLTLEEGMKRTWRWARKKGYQEPVYTKYEIDSPLIPENWKP